MKLEIWFWVTLTADGSYEIKLVVGISGPAYHQTNSCGKSLRMLGNAEMDPWLALLHQGRAEQSIVVQTQDKPQ